MALFGLWARQWPKERRLRKSRIEKMMASKWWPLCCHIARQSLHWVTWGWSTTFHHRGKAFVAMYVLTSGGIHTLVPNQWCPEVLSEDVTWNEIYLTFTDLFVFIKARVGSVTGVFSAWVHLGVYHRRLELQIMELMQHLRRGLANYQSPVVFSSIAVSEEPSELRKWRTSHCSSGGGLEQQCTCEQTKAGNRR